MGIISTAREPYERRKTQLSTMMRDCQLGDHHSNTTADFNASNIATTNNQAVYVRFYVHETCTVLDMAIRCVTVSGTCAFGIYDEAFTRLVTTGSVTPSVGPYSVNVADTTLVPGTYYFGFSSSSSSARYLTTRAMPWAPLRAFGVYVESSAHPLPATATPVAPTAVRAVPIIVAGVIAGAIDY